MAQLIAINEVTDTQPANGKKFTLEEMQGYVGGYVEVVRKSPCFEKGMVLLVNEDAALMGNAPYNPLASNLACTAIYGIALYCLAKEIG